MDSVQALIPVVVLLSLGIAAIIVMPRLGLSPIVGYLLAGIALGPHGLRIIKEGPTSELLAELGVVFLLFDIGLHFSLRRLWEERGDLLGVGSLQIIITAAALWPLMRWAGLGGMAAVITAATLAMSSTAVVSQVLTERGQQTCPIGRSALSVLIFQDFVAIFLLIFAGSALGDENAFAGIAAAAAGRTALAFGAAFLIGRYLVAPAFAVLARTNNEDIFTATALLVVLVAASATGALGLSLTLGAFLGGMILSETTYRHVIRTEVKPFRGLLLGFFFITVGMAINVPALLRHWQLILLLTFAIIVIKTIAIAASALLAKRTLSGALQIGALLAQSSEFCFVIFQIPAVKTALGMIFSPLVAAVALSMMLAPQVSALGQRLSRKLAAKAVDETDVANDVGTAPVVIIGMNEVGRTVADALTAHSIVYTAIEHEYQRLLAATSDGYPVVFGNTADLRLLEMLGIAERRIIVVAAPRFEVSTAVSPILRERYPALKRYVAIPADAEEDGYKALGMIPFVTRSLPRGIEIAAAVLHDEGIDELRVVEWMRHAQDEAVNRALAAPKLAAAA